MPSILTKTSYQAYLAAALVVAFMLAGLWFGIAPDAANVGTFGDVLKAFAREPQTKSIVLMILADVVTGVIAALRTNQFQAQRFAAFMGSNVLPYILGYMLFWFVSYFGLTDIIAAPIAATIANFGFGGVMTALTSSILDNATRAKVGTSPPADIHELLAVPTPTNAQG
jgi:hypothetical protein